jgi:aerobic carbon-monoxide dehydrogenase medium subunit
MLLNLREYHRPAMGGRSAQAGLVDALALLARPGIRTVVLAGGDTLLASADPTIEAVVDLQGLGLDQLTFERDRGMLHIGALVTRARLAAGEESSGEGASYAGLTSPLREILGECAQRWGGSVQRNRATVGGAAVVAADNDPLPAALLVCDAEVVLATQIGEQLVPYAEFLDQRATLLAAPAIVTGLRVPVTGAATGYALETVARTPADAPIVLAVAALTVGALSAHDGRCTAARLALGGVAPIPLRVPAVEAALTGQPLTPDIIVDATAQLAPLVHPAGDFRGSGEYRREMAVVLARRALSQAGRR